MIVIKYYESSLMNKVHRAIIKTLFKINMTIVRPVLSDDLQMYSSCYFQKGVSEKFLAMTTLLKKTRNKQQKSQIIASQGHYLER